MCGDVVHRGGGHREIVGGDPCGHGGEEGVRRRVAAEEPGTVRAEADPRQCPEVLDPGEVAQNFVPGRGVGVAQPQIHRTIAPERGETGVHLCRQGSGHGAGGGILGPESGPGVAFGERLGDGVRVPHHLALGRAHRGHQPGGREIGEKPVEVVGVEDSRVAGHRQAELLEEKPAAQGPARIAAVADGKVIGHGILPFSLASRRPAAGHVHLRAPRHHGR